MRSRQVGATRLNNDESIACTYMPEFRNSRGLEHASTDAVVCCHATVRTTSAAAGIAGEGEGTYNALSSWYVIGFSWVMWMDATELATPGIAGTSVGGMK